MNRRKFIGVSGLSIIGTNSFVASISHIFGLQIKDICSEVLKIMGVANEGQISQLDDASVIHEKLNNWAKSNFLLFKDNVYYTDGNKTLLIPLKQKNKGGSTIDNVLLVFRFNENGIIRYTGNLSGFHMEAISWNKKALLNLGDEKTIRDSILPLSGKGKPYNLGWSFETASGRFDLSAKLDDEGKTLITSAVKKGDQYVWENSFVAESSFKNLV